MGITLHLLGVIQVANGNLDTTKYPVSDATHYRFGLGNYKFNVLVGAYNGIWVFSKSGNTIALSDWQKLT